MMIVSPNERDRFQRYLQQREISTMIHYPITPHRQKDYSDLVCAIGKLRITKKMASKVFSLPIGPHLVAHNAVILWKSFMVISSRRKY